MSRIRFGYQNDLTAVGVVITASTFVTALPPSNAPIPDRTLVWRSTTTTSDQWIAFDLGAAAVVTAACVANPKLHQGGSLKVQYSTDGSNWTDVSALPAADADSKVTFLWVASISARYWRFYFTNTSAVSDYAEIGYPFIGQYFEPTVNVSLGASTRLTTPFGTMSTVLETPGGQRSTTARARRASGTLSWMALGDADLASLQALFRAVDYGTPFFLVLDDARAWTAWLAYFDSPLSRTWELVTGQFDPTFNWKEAL